MQRPSSSRVRGSMVALCAIALLGGCSAVSGTARVPAASPRDWVAMTGASSLAFEPLASPATDLAAPTVALDDDEGTSHGFGHTVLLYIPNRIFDLLDIVRLRLRVGPGFAADIRATEAADAFLGFYTSFFIGIPGPRGKPEINWPLGIENRAGAELSVADASAGGPHYGAVEFGLGVQVALIGADVGIDPWEIVDFITGFLTIDPVHDDL